MAQKRDTRSKRRRLSEALRCFREIHGLSALEAARQIGIHRTVLHRVEQGDAALSAENFLKVSLWLLGFAHFRRGQDRVSFS